MTEVQAGSGVGIIFVFVVQSTSSLLIYTSSRIIHHVTKHTSSQVGSTNMTMSSVKFSGFQSHQILIQKETLGIVDREIQHYVQLTVMSICRGNSKERFLHVVESMSQRFRLFWGPE